MPDTILKHVPGMANASPVPMVRAARLSESAFLDEYVAHSRPCLIKGAVGHWAATEKWRDRDYLKGRYGHDVYYWPHENHVSLKRAEAGKRTVPFAEAVDLIHAADIAAFGTAMPSKLDADLGGFSFFTPAEGAFLYPANRTFFFRNAGSAWHYHPFDETLMCQVMEPKRVGLLRVANPWHRHLRRIFFKEDYYDHPFAFEGLACGDLEWFSASLEAGDALYIPPLWWHGVVATSGGVGATVPITWRSPNHVIVDAIRKMAAGEVDLVCSIKPSQFENVLEFSRREGVEPELRSAWQRGLADRLVSVAD